MTVIVISTAQKETLQCIKTVFGIIDYLDDCSSLLLRVGYPGKSDLFPNLLFSYLVLQLTVE